MKSIYFTILPLLMTLEDSLGRSAKTFVMVPSGTASYAKSCGAHRTQRRVKRIIGGVSAKVEDYPWQVALLQVDPLNKGTWHHHCGGAVVAQTWIITAAHCLIDPVLKLVLPPRFWSIKIKSKKGSSSWSSREANSSRLQEDEARIYNAERIVIHPEFDQKSWKNDLALVKFSTAGAPEPYVIPICLPSHRSDFVGKMCTLSGFGRTSTEGSFSKTLKTVQVPVLSDHHCQQIYGKTDKLSGDMFCAGQNEDPSGPCVGDSGSPLQCQQNNSSRWILAGITSWGHGCADMNYPAVFTKVEQYLHWIHRYIYDEVGISRT